MAEPSDPLFEPADLLMTTHTQRCDYGCWEHRTMRDNRRGAEITVQSMLNALEHRNCVLHMWTPYER